MLAACFAASLAEADGALDLGFGQGGRVVQELTERTGFHLSRVESRSDGTAVVAGWSFNDTRVLVARLRADGTLDASFGEGGVCSLPDLGHVSELEVLASGEVVIAGDFPDLLRLRPDGSAAARIDRGGRAFVNALWEVPGGALLALETTDWSTMASAAVRYGREGLDPGFGSQGVLVLPNGTSQLLPGPDGGFLVAIAGSDGCRVRRFDRVGAPDLSFGRSGFLVLDGDVLPRLVPARNGFLLLTSRSGRLEARRYTWGGNAVGAFSFAEEVPLERWEQPYNATQRPAGGHLLWSVGRDVVLAIDEKGARDASFADGGELCLPLVLELRDLSLAPGGGLFVCGPLPRECPLRGAVLKFLDGGTRDPRFGRAGKVHPDLTPRRHASEVQVAVAPAPGGRILVAAQTSETLVLEARLHDGTNDAGFGSGGRVEVDLVEEPPWGSCQMGGLAVAALPDRKVAVAIGRVLVRFLPDGALDPAFGGTGWVVLPPNLWPTREIRPLPGGGLLLGGGHQRAVLVRLDERGSPDRTFGADGAVERVFVHSPDIQRGYGNVVETVLGRSDGRVVAVGHCFAAAPADFLVARFLRDGRLDPSFGGGDGWTTWKPPGMWSVGSAYAQELPDGRLLLAGETHSFSPSRQYIALARIVEDGRLDSTFGASGHVLTSLGQPDSTRIRVSAMVRQPDGKLLVAGHFEGRPGSVDGMSTGFLTRFLPDGSTDTSFGTSGVLELRPPDRGIGSEIVDLAITGPTEILVGGRQVRVADRGRPASILLTRFVATTPLELVRFTAE